MDSLVPTGAVAARKPDGAVDFFETVRMFYGHMVHVVKPTLCNNYDLLDMSTIVHCCVKLENASQAGDVMCRAFMGEVIGSVLKVGKEKTCLNFGGANPANQAQGLEKRLHIALTEGNPAMLLYLSECIVAAKLMGFNVVIYVNITNTNVLEIVRLVHAKRLDCDIKYVESPKDFAEMDLNKKMDWYVNYLEQQTKDSPYDVPFDYKDSIFYGLVGLACAAYEITQQKDVSAIIVPNIDVNLCFSTLAAFALFSKAYTEKFPEKELKIIPVDVDKEVSKKDDGEFSWVLNYEANLHAVPAFDYLLNLRQTLADGSIKDIKQANDKGRVTKAHLSEFFKSIVHKYPEDAATPLDDESLSLYTFKETLSSEEENCSQILKSNLGTYLEDISYRKLIENKMIEEPLVVSNENLARGFMTSLRVTRTYGGRLGVMALSAALTYGYEMQEKYKLKTNSVCALISGASVNPSTLESIIQWARMINGELYYVELNMPSETEFMQEIIATLKAHHCQVVDVTYRRDKFMLNTGATYTLLIGCNNITDRNAGFEDLKKLDYLKIVKTIPEIKEAPKYKSINPTVIPLTDKPFEDAEHKFSLPQFSLSDIDSTSCEEAEKRLLKANLICQTPIIRSEAYSKLCGCNVYIQLDNLQQTGSFKQRGSSNAILRGIQDSGVKPQHVVAVSAGNHSQGVSLCCRYLGIPCTIVCPEAAPPAKLEATKGYGANVIPKGESFEASVEVGLQKCKELNATFVHPFNHAGVIEGQSTTAVAFHREVPDLDTILVNVGGGGLISGVALYLKSLKEYRTSLGKPLRIIGLQGGNVDPLDTRDIDEANRRNGIYKYVPGNRTTIADGCNVKAPGGIHDKVLRDEIDEYIGVPENYIATAVAHLLVSTRTLVEGAGAIGVAAMMYNLIKVEPEEKVGIIVCGGNINIDHFVQCVPYGARASGRILTVDLDIPDTQTSLKNIIDVAEACCLRFLEVQYLRSSGNMAAENATIRITLSCYSFSSQNEFLIRLVKKFSYEPSIFGREAVPHQAELYMPFDKALEESIKEKEEEFKRAEAEWYKKEHKRLDELEKK